MGSGKDIDLYDVLFLTDIDFIWGEGLKCQMSMSSTTSNAVRERHIIAIVMALSLISIFTRLMM